MAVSAAANAIVTVADLKAIYLNIEQRDPDDLLQTGINQVSDMVERYVRGIVVQRSFTDILNGNGESTLWVPHVPIAALANAAVTDVQYRDDPSETAEEDWHTLEPSLGRIIIDANAPYKLTLWGNVFPVGLQNIRLKSKAGYLAADMPGVFGKVVMEAVAEWYMESKQGPSARLGQQSVSTGSPSGGNVSTSYLQLFFARHSKMLDPYVWPMV